MPSSPPLSETTATLASQPPSLRQRPFLRGLTSSSCRRQPPTPSAPPATSFRARPLTAVPPSAMPPSPPPAVRHLLLLRASADRLLPSPSPELRRQSVLAMRGLSPVGHRRVRRHESPADPPRRRSRRGESASAWRIRHGPLRRRFRWRSPLHLPRRGGSSPLVFPPLLRRQRFRRRLGGEALERVGKVRRG